MKFTALSGFGGDASAALAELSVLYTGPRLAREGKGAIEYQRVRSTSTDVDEGGGPAEPASATKPPPGVSNP